MAAIKQGVEDTGEWLSPFRAVGAEIRAVAAEMSTTASDMRASSQEASRRLREELDGIEQRAGAARGRALVVDDDELVGRSLDKRLRIHGFVDVDVAHNGEEAIKALRVLPYELVVVDFLLGTGPSGTEVVREAQKHPGTRVVLMSGRMSRPELVKTARSLGVHARLYKPFSEDELSRVLRLADDDETT